MDKLDKVTQLIQKAKDSLHNIAQPNVPGLKALEIEGVDQIPLGGESRADNPEKPIKEK